MPNIFSGHVHICSQDVTNHLVRLVTCSLMPRSHIMLPPHGRLTDLRFGVCRCDFKKSYGVEGYEWNDHKCYGRTAIVRLMK